MQHLRQLCAVTALVIAFTFSTFAGEMPYPYVPPTPPPNPFTTAPGETANTTVSSESGEGVLADPVSVSADFMFSLLQGVVVLI